MATLRHQADQAGQRVAAADQRLQRHWDEFQAGWRRRIHPRALLLTGLAIGFALHQLLEYRSHKPVVYETVAGDKPRKKPGKLARAMHLLPLAQLAATKLMLDQSPRSTSRADHSTRRKGNGLSRH